MKYSLASQFSFFFGQAERRSKAAFCLRPLNLLALTVKYVIYTHIHTHTVAHTHTDTVSDSEVYTMRGVQTTT